MTTPVRLPAEKRQAQARQRRLRRTIRASYLALAEDDPDDPCVCASWVRIMVPDASEAEIDAAIDRFLASVEAERQG